ncbi:MAG: hypothetical protein IPJ82_00995 [Lewinellaceae bacterium]|nr:hypothetical protein [Lewinellaceae bacterium]
MFSDKLIALLQTFSKYELNRFRKFLMSPYFNDQDDLVRLFEIINKALRSEGQPASDLKKNDIWKSLYPNRRYDDAHLRRLASDLNQMAMQFVVGESRKQDTLSEALELQRILEKPELQKHLSGVERQIRKHLESMPGQSTWYYLSQFRLHWNIYNRASKVVATSDFMEKLVPADQSLEYFYVVQKLKFYVAWLIYRGFRSTQQDLSVISGFWEHIKQAQFEDIPLVSIYQNVILCLTEPNEEVHFVNLTNSLVKFADKLTKEDLRECYYIAQNYCAFKISQGNMKYYREVFEIFRRMIASGLLLENEQLSEGVYKNIITAGLGVGEYVKWSNLSRNIPFTCLPISAKTLAYSICPICISISRNIKRSLNCSEMWSTATLYMRSEPNKCFCARITNPKNIWQWIR